MRKIEHRHFPLTRLWLVIVATALLITPCSLWPAEGLPARIPDSTFWRMLSECSEEAGIFRFQFMSNEREFASIIPELKKSAKPGGVYLGVGPEQNFSYIAELQPAMAFIIDIRRQNMLEHLLYKAVFELSSNRAEFVSRLFSRKASPALSNQSTARALFEAYGGAARDTQLFTQNLQAIRNVLINDHRLALTSEDQAEVASIYRTIFEAGWGKSDSERYVRPGLSYAELMSSADELGKERSYLASEESFKIVREMQRKNLIMPLVGDFAGKKAIRAVAAYVKEHQAVVAAFYVSNVEQYLFRRGDDWRLFYANVASLPTDASSTLIRSSHFAYEPGGSRLRQYRGTNYFMLLCPIQDLVKAFQGAGIRSYEDALRLSR